MWAAAKPVPARRQKRLFDDTREAEKVLHWLEARQPRDVASLLVATMAHAAVSTLSHHAAPVEVPGLDVAVRHIAARAEMLSRAPTLDFRRYEVSYLFGLHHLKTCLLNLYLLLATSSWKK